MLESSRYAFPIFLILGLVGSWRDCDKTVSRNVIKVALICTILVWGMILL